MESLEKFVSKKDDKFPIVSVEAPTEEEHAESTSEKKTEQKTRPSDYYLLLIVKKLEEQNKLFSEKLDNLASMVGTIGSSLLEIKEELAKIREVLERKSQLNYIRQNQQHQRREYNGERSENWQKERNYNFGKEHGYEDRYRRTYQRKSYKKKEIFDIPAEYDSYYEDAE